MKTPFTSLGAQALTKAALGHVFRSMDAMNAMHHLELLFMQHYSTDSGLIEVSLRQFTYERRGIFLGI